MHEGRYVSLQPDATGVIVSRALPGLLLDRAALLAGDLARVFEVQQAALGNDEHAAFLDRLAGTAWPARRRAIRRIGVHAPS